MNGSKPSMNGPPLDASSKTAPIARKQGSTPKCIMAVLASFMIVVYLVGSKRYLFLARTLARLPSLPDTTAQKTIASTSFLRKRQATKQLLPDVDLTTLKKDVTLTQEPVSEFVLPNHPLEPGELSKFIWKNDGKQVDTYARLVGLPPQLTTEIYDFCQRSGLMDAFWSIYYDGNEAMGARSSHILDLKGNSKGKWAVTSPREWSNWRNSNMHWFDVIDEEAYEETLQVLKRGGFDTVLNAIGTEFKSEGLMIAAMGFIVVSHAKGGGKHGDDPGVGDKFFDLLFPLVIPEHGAAQLYIGDERDDRRLAPINFTRDVGILMSGDTTHATGDCDYRESKGPRVAVTIYIADVDKDIAKVIAGDGTALFPVPGNTDWLMAQKGRLWGTGNSLEQDKGRMPYTAKDIDEEGCPVLAEAGMCDKDPWHTRKKCQRSCNIFIDDNRYYAEVIGQ